MTVHEILIKAAEARASDIHFVPMCPPLARINGNLVAIPGYSVLSPTDCASLVYQFFGEEQRTRFERERVLDFSIVLQDIRFRGNALVQRNGIEAILRIIPSRIPTPEELLIPPHVTQLTEMNRGLILVTGPTGSGKSTTLASLINVINHKRRANIITIEDPIEFVYQNKSSVVSQREIGIHAPDFHSALKFVLRQDPDVVLIGELRDLETISAALTVAETGHLVFATLHTSDAAQAVDRIIDVYPANQQQQVRAQLATTLKAVIAQTLVARSRETGRVAAREIMIVTPAIANLIRQGKTHEIYSAIEMGVNQGMVSLDRSLGELYKRGLIDANEAMNKSNNPEATVARHMNPR